MLSWESIISAAGVLLAGCAAVVTVAKALETFEKFRKPQQSLQKEVEQHDKTLREDHEHLVSIDEGLAWQNRCMLQVMNHLIDGNHTSDLIQTRDQFQQYLIEK